MDPNDQRSVEEQLEEAIADCSQLLDAKMAMEAELRVCKHHLEGYRERAIAVQNQRDKVAAMLKEEAGIEVQFIGGMVCLVQK